MKQLRHVLALTLVFCMVFGMVTPSLAVSGEISVEEDYGIPVEEDGGIEIEVDDRSDYDIDEDREELSVLPKQDETADETNTTGKVDGYNYNIIHLDCGRKYFSVDSIKKIIDNASAAGFNYIQLAVGNDGMRFLLDDMSLTVNGTTYDSNAVSAAIHAGNEAYYNFDVDELTETEMNTIIAYAYEKGMGVIPLINTPGHMDAILAAATSLTDTNCAYNGSARTIDVTNSTAVAFTKAFLNKYITYFAGKGCTLFNMGADEYANDRYTDGSMGFGNLQGSGKYSYFVTYVNEVAELIKNAGMTPMAFNDGIYFNNNTWSGTFDTNIIIEYWSSGWSSYIPMSASGLADKGFKMVNTHGDYYWVLGKPDAQCSATKASGFDKTVFPGSTISNPGGSTFCIWSDYPGAETEASVISKTADTIEAFGGAVPTVDKPITNASSNGATVYGLGVTTAKVSRAAAPVIDNAVEGKIEAYYVEANATNGYAALKLPIDASWNSAKVKAFVVSQTNGDSVTTINGTYNEDGTYTFFAKLPTIAGLYEAGAANVEDVYVTVGGTETITIPGNVVDEVNAVKNSINTAVATVEKVEHKQVEGSTTRVLGNKIDVSSSSTSTGVITDGKGNYMVVDSEGSLSGTKKLEEATEFTVTKSSDYWSGDSYTIKAGNYYLALQENFFACSLIVSTNSYSWRYNNNGFYKSRGFSNYYITYYSGWTVNDSSSNSGFLYAFTNITTDPVDVTEVTFKGVAEGDTSITVGDTRYNIHVSKENLDEVTPITVEYWITNSRLTGTESNKDKVTITAQEAFGEGGVDIGTLVDAMGAKEGRTQEYWQSKILDVEKTNTSTSGTELQTTKNGDDETLNGSAFTKIRYYEGKWQVYTTDWTDVDRTQVRVDYTNNNSVTETYSGDKNQLVAYYMEVVDINNANGESELHVNAADWGIKGSGGDWGSPPDSMRCSVSVQIVYEDKSTNPTDTTENDLKSKTIVYGYWSGGRGLGTMIFSGQQNYQIYKVTAETGTMTSSERGNYVTVKSFTWDKNEETVWEGDATKSVSIGNPARKPSYVAPYDNLAWNTDYTDAENYNNNNAILIRVYVKAAATEDSLKVNYVDKGTGTNFYNYNITVEKGITFNAGFALDSNGELVNNTVVNYNGVTQKVNSNLKEMPEISSYYRFSNFNLKEVKRSTDGKEVWLYYTFNNRHDFVVDFGVPLHLDPADIGLTGGWDTAKINLHNQCDYGIPDLTLGGGLTYTPNKVMRGVETIAVDLSDSNNPNDDPATHFIYLYPATNVLYEENVLTQATTANNYVAWNYTAGTVSEKRQAAEKLGAESVHGYDAAYAGDKTFSAGSYYHATLNETNKFTKNLTFTFTGTGFDVISECGPQTGMLVVAIKNSAGKTVKVAVADTLFNGDSTYITGTSGILDYQVPVYRNLGLEYDTYTVNIGSAYADNRPTDAASVASLHSNDTYSIVSDILDAFGYDDVNVEDVELVYMDENSVLNGGTGVVSEKAITAFSANLAEEYAVEPNAVSTEQNVYVDGVRIYGTLANDPGYATAEKDVKYDSVYDFAKNSAVDFDTEIGNACIYVEYDGNQDVYNIADYKQQGPENEVYLTPGSGIAFQLNGYTAGMTVQVSAKTIATEAGNNVAIDPVTDENNNEVAALVDFKNTSTEMYYKVNVIKDAEIFYVLIVNNADSSGILSLSDVKVNSDIEACITPELITVINNDKEAAFVPDTFEISYIAGMANVTLGDTIQVSSKLSYLNKNNVETEGLYVVVTSKDGTEIVPEKQLKASNAKAVERGKTNIYRFNYALFTGIKNVPITTAGEYKLTFYAKDTNGNVSGKLVFNVNVAASEN